MDTSTAAPVFTSIVADNGSSASDGITNDPTPVYNGTSAPGAVVSLTRTGVGGIGNTTADGTGVWTFNYTGTTLPAGTHTFIATASTGGSASPASPLNGERNGSLQLLPGESFAVNGNGVVSGDILVPGTPTTRLNGRSILVGVKDGLGNEAPSNDAITFNGGALARFIVRRADPIELPVVVAPQPPAGSRDVVVNSPGEKVGDFATIRNLTLNGNAGSLLVPPGVYGNLAANGNGGFAFGVTGGTGPAVYELERLALNGNATLQIVGPVLLNLANGVTLNGTIGSASSPFPLTVEIYNGGLTLNGHAALHGDVIAPSGSVIINGTSELHGTVSADRLAINGNGLLSEEAP